MKNVTSRKHLYATLKPLYLLSLFLHMIVTLVVAQDDDGSSVYAPPDLITVACGYTGPQLNSLEQRYWIGDVYSKYSPLEEHQSGQASVVREAPPSSSVTKMPYTWARLSRSAFTYRFSLATDGQKFIRLYFNPVSYGPDLDRSKALFSVAAGGYTFLHDFNASVTADAYGVETLCREFCLNVDGKKLLNITFTPSQSSLDAYAFINGIEIVSMPTNLYYTAPDGVISYVGNGGGKEFRVGNSTALETVYRMNVGGIPLSPTQNDSFMYRNWDGLEKEQNYLEASSLLFSSIEHANITLSFSRIPNYAAPTQVYQTGRSIMSADSTLNYNLSWEFPVDSEFAYLVRMHFCGLPPVEHFGSFEIYIADHKAEEQANILAWGGGAGIPLYRDYVVSMDSSGSSQKQTNLSVAMYGPSNSSILNGLEIFKLNNSRGNLAGPGPNPDPRHHVPRPKMTHMRVIVAGAVSGIVVLISALVGAFLIFRRNWRKAKSSNANSLLPYSCRYFSLAEIKAATQNFNSCFIIGVGGFGNVYRGCIDGGATQVAIKRLKPESSQGAHEFKTEIEMLSQLRHRHLVSLIGYSSDKGEMILVYDYMARGTLADHLYHHKDNQPPSPLSWEQRLHICMGAARGLQYLHSGAKGTIIHRDVKSTNILLDEKWVAKVSDFGLSKMGTADTSKTHISTVVKGSFGYLDPEYYRLQRLTEKSDVYSFGVVLCEVLCGRPAVMHTDAVELGQINLAQWAKRCYHDGKLNQIIDPSIHRGGKMIETEGLNKFVEISMSCMHDNGIERPSMNDVVRGLEFALQLHHNCVESNASSSEQSCVTDESIKCISATIFSEIRDPSGR
ncbi:hypothetical protein ACE6H2_012114 [Prunus campanulata]